ncbi:MAG: GGDEF domain-containing protein [Rhodospirillales bacterium]|nr:GGDEF domain-containing protein [Rhodospirillales bacterium]
MYPVFLTWGGEFADPAREADYQAERLAESARHARLLFGFALLMNLLFYLSDWRFFGHPHFAVSMVARSVIVAVSLAGMLAAGRIASFRKLAWLSATWAFFVIAASVVLIAPHSSPIGLLITFVMPMIYYLALSMPFRWALVCGLGGSIAPLASYMAFLPSRETWPGLILALITLNIILALVLIRSNRLQRLAWVAIQAERMANDQLARHHETLQALLQAVPAPMIIVNRKDGAILQANDAASSYFGDRLLGQARAIQATVERRHLRKLIMALKAKGRIDGFEVRLQLGGTARDVLLSATTAEIDGVEAVLVALTDITGRKEMEANLERLASTDPLTGLVNRAHFFTLAKGEIRRARRHGRPLAVIMADIDHFKRINDTYGHGEGDRALTSFANLCRTLVRAEDTVARLGGEEFGLLLPETGTAQAMALANRLRAAVEDLHLGGLPAPITISIGISQFLAGETTVEAALSRADQALYAAKRSGRNRVVHFDAAA